MSGGRSSLNEERTDLSPLYRVAHASTERGGGPLAVEGFGNGLNHYFTDHYPLITKSTVRSRNRAIRRILLA